MKYFISTGFLLFTFCSPAISQFENKVIPAVKADSQVITVNKKDDPENFRYINNQVFRKRVLMDFSSLAIGQSNTSAFSNYLSISATEPSLKASGAVVLDSGSRVFLTADLAANTLDNNVAELFSGFKVNSSVNVNLKLHIRPWTFTRYYYLPKQKRRLEARLDDLLEKQTAELTDYRGRGDRLNKELQIKNDSVSLLSLEKEQLRLESQLLDKRIDTLNNLISKTPNDTDWASHHRKLLLQKLLAEKQQLGIKIAHLEKRELLLAQEIQLTQQQISSYNRHRNENIKRIEEKYKEQDEELQLNADWNGFRMLWFTLRYNPFANNYYVFDTTNNPAAARRQSAKEKYSAYSVGGEINFFRWRASGKHTLYTNAGLYYKRNNNISELDALEVEEKYLQTDPTAALTRNYIAKYKAYDKDSITQANEISLFANYYHFLGKNGDFAPHLNINYRIIENTPQFDFQVGLLFEAKNKEKEKSTLNIEVFAGVRDFFNDRKQDNKIKDRTVLGVRINFPFTPSLIPKSKK